MAKRIILDDVFTPYPSTAKSLAKYRATSDLKDDEKIISVEVVRYEYDKTLVFQRYTTAVVIESAAA